MKSLLAAPLWLISLLVATPVLPGPVADQPPPHSATAPSAFQFQWTGKPSAPTRWVPQAVDDWDVVVHDRDIIVGKEFPIATAQHGPDCTPFPATHVISTPDDSVFICNNHMMTVSNSPGYGEIELTPARLADWSGGTTSIIFRVSTFRTSNRDWLDINVSPFEDNLVAPATSSVDLNGLPPNVIHCEMSPPPTRWGCYVLANSQRSSLATGGRSIEDTLASKGQPTSAVTRTLLELDISPTHVRMGMPEYNNWFVDSNVTVPFAQGVVQLGHHTYSPDKECDPTAGVLSCTGNTWHWSDFSISSSVPFTMLRLPVGLAPLTHYSKPIVLPAAAPADSFLRFSGAGIIEFSVNGGKTWMPALEQPSTRSGSLWKNYWTPIPAGTRTITFRGRDIDCCWWMVQDPAVWSLNLVSASSVNPPLGQHDVGLPPAAAVQPPANKPASIPNKESPLETAWHLVRPRFQTLLLPLLMLALLLSFIQLLRARRTRR